MPTQILGYNKEGEKQWFNGNKLPEGWMKTPPEPQNDNMSEDPKEHEEPKKRGRPPMKGK